MRILTSTNQKISSAEKMPQEEIVVSSRKAVTGKHVLVAVTILLAVAVVVAGFVTAFYLFKQSSTEHSDNMTKIYELKLRDGGSTINEFVETNVKQRITEIKTESQQSRTILYNDFKKGLSVMVLEGGTSRCFVYPLNKTLPGDPEEWNRYMQKHQGETFNMTKLRTEETSMIALKHPIQDSTFLGTKINDLCEGKDIHWMYPSTDSHAVRKKRAICIRVCWIDPCGCETCICIIIEV